MFWTLPTAILSGAGAAAGIALINSIGNLGGYVGPFLMGYLKGATGNYQQGLCVLAGCLLVGGLLTLQVGARVTKVVW